LQLCKGPAREVPLKWSPKMHAAEMRKQKADKRAPKKTVAKDKGAVALMRRPAVAVMRQPAAAVMRRPAAAVMRRPAAKS